MPTFSIGSKMSDEKKEIPWAAYPVDENDVKLIMKNVEGITKAQATHALIQSRGDLVDAVISLTTHH